MSVFSLCFRSLVVFIVVTRSVFRLSSPKFVYSVSPRRLIGLVLVRGFAVFRWS